MAQKGEEMNEAEVCYDYFIFDMKERPVLYQELGMSETVARHTGLRLCNA